MNIYKSNDNKYKPLFTNTDYITNGFFLMNKNLFREK